MISKWFWIVFGILIGLIAFGLLYKNLYITKQTQLYSLQRRSVDELYSTIRDVCSESPETTRTITFYLTNHLSKLYFSGKNMCLIFKNNEKEYCLETDCYLLGEGIDIERPLFSEARKEVITLKIKVEKINWTHVSISYKIG